MTALEPRDYVRVTLPDGTEAPGRVRDIDVARGEVWVFLAYPFSEQWHDAGGSYTARLDQVKREEAA